MFDKDKEFSYEKDENFDFVLEEKANNFVALRKIKWKNQNEFKLDIRKYRATETGEVMLKGCSLTDKGANELTKILIEQGYGKDKDIYDAIINNRQEITSRFIETIKNSSDKEIEEHLENYPIAEDEEENDDAELYDLEDVLGG